MNSIIEERLISHLTIIETVYSVTINNKEEVAKLIADSTSDEKNALAIATSLNTWVMMNSTGGSITIPISAVQQLQDKLKIIGR
ncbi:MAG: hypothetical protein K8R25_04270 [Methanosarcinales archaeon]|nr:hypothetical protein [Methanosarcinales archaeon]